MHLRPLSKIMTHNPCKTLMPEFTTKYRIIEYNAKPKYTLKQLKY